MREAIASASARSRAGDHRAHEASAKRLLCIDRLAGEDHLERRRAADEAREALGAARERQQADQDIRQGERRVFGRHPNVAGERELEAGAGGIAVDRADDGPWQFREAAEGVHGDTLCPQSRDRIATLARKRLPVPAA